jgi:hypothetical protein
MTPPPALADEPRLVNRMIMNHFKFRDPGGEGFDGIERQGLNPVMNAFLEYVDGHRARKFGLSLYTPENPSRGFAACTSRLLMKLADFRSTPVTPS